MKGPIDHSQSKYHHQLGEDQALLEPSRCQSQTNAPCSLGSGSKSLTYLAKPVAEGWIQTVTSLTRPHASQHATAPQQSNSPACLWTQLQRQLSCIMNHVFHHWTSPYCTNPVKDHQFLQHPHNKLFRHFLSLPVPSTKLIFSMKYDSDRKCSGPWY